MRVVEQINETITVIMSVRNNAGTVGLAIDSLLNQTYDDFKVIVIDDASTDTTSDILNEFERNNENITVIRNNESRGLADNLNTMLNMAETRWVARMDGDDICYPTRFEKQMDFLTNNPDIDILGTAAHIIDENGRKNGVFKWPSRHENIKKSIWCNPMIHPSIIMKRQKIIDIGGYPPYPRRQDYALWFKAIKTGLQFHNLPEHLIQYRIVKKHYKKDNLKQLLRQARIGWLGYASVGGYNPLHYGIMAWPVVRSFLPISLQAKLQKYLRRYDPRRKPIKKLDKT